MSIRLRTATLSLVLGAVLVVAGGCGGQSFVGRRYDNFTAYYNTFYNARKAFDEGVKALERTDARVDRRFYIDVFTAPGRAANTATFQKAIDKSADVLRDHPGSKWVDDALLLIGQSYFYLQNFVGAEQKFREVIQINSGLEDEARLWLARTLIAAGSYDAARDHLLTSLEQEDLSNRWEPQLRLALGELYVKREEFEAAAEELAAGLENVRDRDLRARGWMLLGQVLERIERYEDAVAAYDRVDDAHPPYELSYAANVSAIRVQGLYVDGDEALRRLRRMQRDDKHFSNLLELEYLEGLVHQAQGRPGIAHNQYLDILYDSEGQLGDIRGRIHYALAELYRTVRRDFMTAAAHYDTARSAIGNPSSGGAIQAQFAPEAIVDVAAKAEMFSTFARVRQDVARMDSLLELGSLDDEAFTERILEIRRRRAEELTAQQRLIAQRQAEQGFQEAGLVASGGGGDLASQSGEAGFLFHRDPVRTQENRLNFIMRWGDRPHVPNWRRAEAVAGSSPAGTRSDDPVAQRAQDMNAEVGSDPLPQIDYSDVPRDSLSQAKMRAMRALARYELGNVLFLSMNRPDSAAAWYRLVIDEDSDEPVAQRAYYALAEVQRSLGDTARAQMLYEQVLRDFPESDFAGRVREHLGIRQDVPADSLARGLAAYEESVSRWRRGLHRRSLIDMVNIAADYRQTDVAPKALLAAARIFMEWADKDSLDLFDPIPITFDDELLLRAGFEKPAPDEDVLVPASDSLKMPADSTDLARDPSGVPADVPNPAEDAAETEAPSTTYIPLIDETSPDDSAGGYRPPLRSEPSLPLPADSAATNTDPPVPTDSVRNGVGDSPASVLAERGDSASSEAADSVSSEAADSLASVSMDSLASVSMDSMASEGSDSLTLPDSPTATRESANPDSLAPADSLLRLTGAVLDSASASLAMAMEPANDFPIYLTSLYAAIQKHYPTTDYARQAAEILDAIESYRAELEPPVDSLALARVADTTGAVAADSLAILSGEVDGTAGTLAADSVSWALLDSAAATKGDLVQEMADAGETAAVDTASTDRTEAPGATPVTPDDETSGETDRRPPDAQGLPSGEEALRGEGGIDQELGGYTLALGMNVKREPMEELAAKYAAEGFRTGVITERVGGTTIYRAALGQFASAAQAYKALELHADELESGTLVAPLKPTPAP